MLRLKLFTLLFIGYFGLLAEGSKNLTPSNSGDQNGENTFVGYLQHNDGGNSGNFLKDNASEEEKLKIYIRDGETLYYGLRRVADGGGNNTDLIVTLYDAANNVVMQTTLTRDQASTEDATLNAAAGVIGSYAQAAAGPSAIVGGGGYNALSYTNNLGTDQDFWVSFVETGGQTRSSYDLWDFSVYDGAEEKVGRLHSKVWSFNGNSFTRRLSTEFQMFVLVDGVGADGFYVKEIDIQGIQPYGMLIYSNSTGADPADLGTTDFLELRRSQTTNVALPEYDIFVNNPDIDLYPTATLPIVEITDFNTVCNPDGTASAVVSFQSNLDGIIGLLINLNGTPGYQANSTDILIESQVVANVRKSLIWNGLDGLGNPVASGTNLSVTGRYTAGPVHLPLWDVEINAVGVTMNDVRPSTTFNQIFWDDSNSATFNGGFSSSPQTELNGTNTTPHTWDDCNNDLINTWSYGYLQVNSQTVNFTYDCDSDNDGIPNLVDADNDDDGIPDNTEGDINADVDNDGIPDYLDADFPGFTDSNNDGIDDSFDADLDGIPNALDLDSDNDGIPDVIENGGTDANNDGIEDNASTFAFFIEAEDATVGSNFSTVSSIAANGGEYVTTNVDDTNFPAALAANRVRFSYTISSAGDYRLLARISAPTTADDSFYVVIDDDTGNPIRYNEIGPTDVGEFLYDTLHSDQVNPFDEILLTLSAGAHTIDFYYREDGAFLDATYLTLTTPIVTRDTDQDGIADYLDIDSDNDGIVDVLEAGGSVDATSGSIANFTDTDRNGWNDNTEIFRLPRTNSDGGVDGLSDYRDIDSDNDGILDNREAFNSQVYVAPGSFIDTDNDGLNDIYDPNNGGNLISPVNTDNSGAEDFRDTDSDNDGVNDLIEGFDNNSNGFGDWDLVGTNNLITDEVGYNVDADADGLWDIFDTEGTGASAGISNVTASNASHQNTDNADNADWQDIDDDNDEILTSGEDSNGNKNFADDKTQGQSGSLSPPDYLFKGDYDDDGIADIDDLDSDNDGITDINEDGGTGIDPSADDNADGLVNYKDSSIAGFIDVNGDGIDDRMDADQDGIPNFLDADSDNDGIYDAYEANNGVAPAGFDINLGQFLLDDPDNDGLMNQIDNNTIVTGGQSNLPKSDFDGDLIDDYLDLDSDNDGIPDNIEFQGEDDYVAPTGVDSDGDGVDNAYDPSSGGTFLTGINTDGLAEPDFRDTDSDDDNILDRIEGSDSDNNGIGDWDDNSNGLTDEADYSTDTDGDGIVDAYDNVATIGDISNITGTNAVVQNSDGLDNRDWRDTNDDNDADLTIDEDDNSNGDYTDDRTDGQGLSSNIPDYLFKGDNDSDGIADKDDTDSDNDGIPDIDEAGTLGVDPSQDADGDGIPNYRDADIAGFIDSNGDGVDDRADNDRDGVPDYHDLDSDNDGIPDAVEANNGTLPPNMTSNGQFPLSYVTVPANDPDGDGFPLDVDPDDGGTALPNLDHDGDGLKDYLDLDSDNDGLADLVEGGGVDIDGDGRIDNFNDTNNDGLSSIVDFNEGGSPFTYPNSDSDSLNDYLDVDSDGDGIADATEQGGRDTNSDGELDDFVDTDNDGFSDIVDTDNGGESLVFNDQDGDGLQNYQDLDSDNDGRSDIVEGGGVDADHNGLVDGSDLDANNNGYYDSVELNPFPGGDTDNDGQPDFADIDSDNDGIVDVIEYGLTADANGRLSGFDDSNNGNGLNDAQEGVGLTLPDSDGDGIVNHLDLDSDNDGIVDFVESQTKSTLVSLTGNDTDGDGLDDAFDPDNGGTLLIPVNTDGDANADFLDDDSDGDTILDIIEGDDANKDGFGDWDTDLDADFTDETGYNTDLDLDGILDIFDTFGGLGTANIIGSNTANQDTDNDDEFDFQDVDDDGDGINTGDGTGGTEGTGLTDDPDGNIPNYLYKTRDEDGDTIEDTDDLDSDNDGILDTDEDGGVGVDPSADADGDGRLNYEDADFAGYVDINNNGTDDRYDKDGDGVPNFLDLDSDNDGIPDAVEANSGIVPLTGYTVANANYDPANDADGDGLADAVDSTPGVLGGISTVVNPDTDSDGIKDVLDIDSDNDGLTDNRESQVSGGSYISPVKGDSDNDGLLNVYDGNTGATSITPVNTDGSVPDYLNLDSDGDGLNDIIEGHDADSNGFADWDTDGDNSITNEIGYNADRDNDGLWNIYDTNNTVQGITNIDASNADYQDTNNDGDPDYRDDDDDGDGITTADEDSNPMDGNYANDFTQGGVTIPDYLFFPDKDGDGILDAIDLDSDDDGISNLDEYAGAVYGSGGTPFDDADGDNIYNYLDDSDINNPSYVDVNGDGVDDQVDQDFDGVPNFLDIDSDNDGIVDAIEAGGIDANNDGRQDVVSAVAQTSTGVTLPSNALGKPLSDPLTYARIPSGRNLTLDLGDTVLSGSIIYVYLARLQTTGVVAQGTITQSENGSLFSNSLAYSSTLDISSSPLGYEVIAYTTTADTRYLRIATSARTIAAYGARFMYKSEDFDNDGLDDYLDLDSDNDGISDNQEGQSETRIEPSGNDTDNDGLDDSYDTDNGGTAIQPINTDRLVATFGDSEPDYRDLESDGDGVADRVEGHDGNINGFADWDSGQDDNDYTMETGYNTDSDNDGIVDLFDNFTGFGVSNINGTIADLQDTDSDGTRDWRDLDDDGDEVPTRNEDGPPANGIWYDDKNQGGGASPDYLFFADKDLDGVADNVSFDADNDGIPNSIEIGGLQNPYNDGDGDGIPAFQDSSETGYEDVNNDGVDDRYDTDFDGQPDFLDLDSDNDGIPDAVEANGGIRPDGMNSEGKYSPAYTQANDANSNGLVDDVEASQGGTALAIPDSDGDGLADYIDLDSDNDGIPDIVEAGGSDSNNDGKIDAFGDSDADGLANAVDVDNGGSAYNIEDLDGDGLPNYIDTDSDNDGLSDLYESNGTDITNDGRADVATDTDGDGWADLFDSDNGGTALSARDRDNDGNENYRDLDSDNDGIPDAVERNGGSLPANMTVNGEYSDAYVAANNDADNDGLLDDTDGTTPTIASTDGDGLADHLDLDSDNDGIQDIIEAGGTDTDNNGKVDNFVDTDDDGLADTFDSDNSGTALAIPNSDGDGSLPDYRDIDSDNDGIPDIIEMGGEDADNDGLPASSTVDSDNDGWSDTFDSNNGGTALSIVDIDGDGLFGFQDLDADNDGVSDVLEVNGLTDGNNDGVADVITDTDGDGWPDTFDNDNGASPYTYRDTDGDGLKDFADLDSDNDGLPDALEANDGVLPVNMNSNGQYSSFTDTDGDGYGNDRDGSNSGTLYADTDTDGDSYIDRYDLDSDNDGIPDAVEGNGGTLPANMNSNGTYNVFTDTDNDGLHDDVDSDNSGTALINPNSDNGLSGGDSNRPDYRDLDADADGIVDVIEAGGLDGDNDGIIGTGVPTDTDNDGLANDVDDDNSGTALPYTDFDSDGSPNYRDTDSDNDSVDDLIEAFDSNSDVTTAGGTVDGVSGVTPAGTDADNDGIDDNFEGAIPSFQDTDGTGGVDMLDTDDDGDGIPSADEKTDFSPVNGVPDYLEVTSNPCGANSVQVYPVDADITPGNGLTEAETDGAIGEPDGLADGTNAVPIYTGGDEVDIDMLQTGVPLVSITWKRRTGGSDISTMTVLESIDDVSYTTLGTATTDDPTNYITSTFTPAAGSRFIRITKIGAGPDFDFDAIGICSPDQDNDLIADRNDLDDDNDGIPDATEISGFGNDPSADDDADGELNFEDADIAGFVDSNADNVNDNFDQDLDGVPNHLDLDSDNDGITDAMEANAGNLPANMTANGRYPSSYVISNDGDADGLANDVDTDNAGTVLENPNSDGDGNVDFLDLDSDNDGLPDLVEAGGVDTDNDGQLDGTTDTNNDGLINIIDTNEGGAALLVPDSDADGLKNYRDVDSDNDGLADIIEAGGVDGDGNGVTDIATDSDSDGWVNTFDSDNGGTVLVNNDTDTDGIRNYLDLDSDNDGLPDALEGNGGTLPSDMDSDGQYGSLTDTDGDGLHDNVDTNDGGVALLRPNTDGLGGVDYLDLDSDNDGLPDILENGGVDANNDGRVDNITDTDVDGIVDTYDLDNGGAPLVINDTDGDGLPTYRDLDSDNDGIPDVVEFGGTDVNGDGLTDNSTDNDGDGWSNTYDADNGGTPFAVLDMDGDGLNNNIDLDTDSDGIADAYEGNNGPLPADMNADGQYTSLTDTDGDGLHDNIDTNNGGTALLIPNTDGTDGPDFRDIDADGDGINDFIEGFDDDENGNASNDFVSRAAAYELNNGAPGQYPATDSDGDGIPDWLEDVDSDGLPNYLDPDNAAYFDSDGDGLVNLHDMDANGVSYSGVSGEPDNNGNGKPNQYDSDDDIALPVTLVSFKGQFIEDKVVLKWVTATELNNDYFDIERSIDGLDFETIARVFGAGNSQDLLEYDLIDMDPIYGNSYYRLKQVDFDGVFEYSSIINVKSLPSEIVVNIYPNPVSDYLSIRVNNDVDQLGLDIYDLSGQNVVYTKKNILIRERRITLDLSFLNDGIYIININANESSYQSKLIIRH